MVRVPQYISRPPQIIWFELDELIVFLIPVMVWMLVNFSFIFAMVLSVLSMIYYKKMKHKAARGFLYHIYYMLGGKFKGFESVHVRSYRE